MLNHFFKQVECDLPGFHFNVDFSNEGPLHNLFELLSESGISGLRAVSNFKNTSQVSLVVGARASIFCVSVAEACLTKISLIWSDALLSLSRKQVDLEWRDDEFHKLQTKIFVLE